MAGFQRKCTKSLAVAVLLLSAATIVFPQSPKTQVIEEASTGSLSGKLTDLHSRPLDAVAVVLRNQATGAEARTTTTKSGSYRFTDLQPGEYTLEAESEQLGRGRVEDIVVDAGHEAHVQTAMEFEPLPARPVLAASPGAEPPRVEELPSRKQPSVSQPHPEPAPPPVKAAMPAEPLPSPPQTRPSQRDSASSKPPVPPVAKVSQATAAKPLPPAANATVQAPPPPVLKATTAASAQPPAQTTPPPPNPVAAASQQGNPVSLSRTGTMSAHELQALPISGRRWQDFALDSAPASATPPGSQGQISVRGAGEAQVSVDGAAMSLAFGATNGPGQRSSGQGSLGQAIDSPGTAQVGAGGHGLAVSEAAIRSVETAAGYVEAAADKAAGGRIDAETQSGANALHGQGFLFDRQNGWGAQNPFTQWVKETASATLTTVPVFTPEPYTPADRETTGGIGLGGRIRRDKLFWFAALDSYSRNDPAVAAVRHPDLFFNLPEKNGDAQMEVLSARMGPSNNPLAAGVAAYSGMLETLDALLGPAPRTAKQWTGFGRLDWRASERQSFTLEAIAASWNSPGGGLTRVSETYGNHSFGSSKAGEEWLLGRWEAFLTPNLLAVSQASTGRTIQEARPSTPSAFEQTLLPGNLWGQLPEIVVDNRYGFTIGNSSRFGPGSYPDERLYHGQESLDWIRGKLLAKAGFEVSHNADTTSLLRNQTGTYTYSSVENFVSDALVFEKFGLTDALDPLNSDQHYCDDTGRVWTDSSGNPRGQGSLPCYSYYSQTIGPSGWRLSTNDWAGYATAQWQAGKLVAASAGLRWEREQLPPPIAALANPANLPTPKLPRLGNNWAPRLSLAVGNGEKHWPVLRLGYGMYYGRTENATVETALTQTGSLAGDLNFFMRPTDNLNGGGAPPFPYVLTGPPGSVVMPGAVEFAPNFRNPEVHQAVAAVEETLPGHVELTASAMVSLGRRMPISIDTNIGLPATETITYNVCDETSTTTQCAFAGVGPIKSPQITVPFYASWPPTTSANELAGRINPHYQQITQIMSRANSTYEALIVKVERYSRRGLSLHAHYTYSHAMDWNPNESAQVAGNDVLDPASLTDPAAFRLEYGTSDLDMRHSAAAMAVYEAPWKLRGRAGKFANGWMLSGIGNFRSGLPYTMRTSGSLAEEFDVSTPIVGLGPGINGSGGDNRVYGTGSDGHAYNVGRNTFRYPATWKADLRLGRRFDLGHNREIEALAESFNLLNHQNVTEVETTGYTIESGSPTSPLPTLNFLTGLKPNTTAFGQPLNINATSFYPVRQFQLGLRVRF
ncbi:MAG: carboxypeptidase regulatory-like domain-containing protein [Terracidiphilus sp.]